jgi:hypothetical protein
MWGEKEERERESCENTKATQILLSAMNLINSVRKKYTPQKL